MARKRQPPASSVKSHLAMERTPQVARTTPSGSAPGRRSRREAPHRRARSRGSTLRQRRANVPPTQREGEKINLETDWETFVVVVKTSGWDIPTLRIRKSLHFSRPTSPFVFVLDGLSDEGDLTCPQTSKSQCQPVHSPRMSEE